MTGGEWASVHDEDPGMRADNHDAELEQEREAVDHLVTERKRPFPHNPGQAMRHEERTDA